MCGNWFMFGWSKSDASKNPVSQIPQRWSLLMSSRIFTLNPTYTHWYFKQWVCGHKNSQTFRAILMINRILFCHMDACHCVDKDINSGFLMLTILCMFPILIKMDYFFNENESHQETDKLLFNILFSHL